MSELADVMKELTEFEDLVSDEQFSQKSWLGTSAAGHG